MPKKTLALIAGLVVVTVVLFIIAIRAGQQQETNALPKEAQISAQPTPMVPAHTVLKLAPASSSVAPGQVGTVNITMDTADNSVTAVQLELGYDPNIIGNVKVTPGPLFANAGLNYGKDNPIAGRYTYMLGISPNGQTIKGTGVVATVTFTAKATASGKNMQLALLPTSLVTARGVAQSVLKSANGTVITIGSTAAAPIRYNAPNTAVPAK